jgi:hypothetical protein
VDQEQVHVLEPQLLQALLQRGDRRVEAVVLVVQLCGDEHLAPGQPGVGDRVSDALFVAVHLSGVDVSVAGLERLPHGLRGLVRVDLEDPEAELRDLDTVVQPEIWYLSHAPKSTCHYLIL